MVDQWRAQHASRATLGAYPNVETSLEKERFELGATINVDDVLHRNLVLRPAGGALDSRSRLRVYGHELFLSHDYKLALPTFVSTGSTSIELAI